MKSRRMSLPGLNDVSQSGVYQDTLTGLGNRCFFNQQLKSCLKEADAHNTTLLVGIVNLDSFKSINDLFGLSAGDDILRQAALRLREHLSDHAVIARYDGDEFAFLVEDNDASGAAVVDAIREALSAAYHLENRPVRLSISLGLAVSSSAGQSANEVLKSAEAALYQAKRRGRGQVACYSPVIDAEIQHAAKLEHALRHAIVTDAIDVHFQPIVSLADNRLVGFEALARWDDSELGLVPPDIFVPLAEERGFIDTLAETLLRKALKAALAWPEHLFLSFNLSPAQLLNPGTVDNILSILQNKSFDPRRLELEITEAAMAASGDIARANLAALRQAGVRISLDDFGQGQSNLGRLREFSFDKIKIDRAFVSRMNSDRASEYIVRAILTMCEGLDMEVVAEGIEHSNEATRLSALGCGMGQGYLFGRPENKDKTLSYLKGHSLTGPQTCYAN